MSYKVLIKDAQGHELRVGNPKKAISQAAQLLRCKKDDVHIINMASETCRDVYLFSHADADAAYWLEALKITETPCYIGKPGC